MKIDKRRLDTSLKITSRKGIFAFTVFGVVGYLLFFSFIAFETLKEIDTWKIYVGAFGGAIFVGAAIIFSLRLSRYILIRLIDKNVDTTIY